MAFNEDDFKRIYGGIRWAAPDKTAIEEDKKKKRQEELLAAAKAEDAKKAEGKNFFQQAGDVIGGVGNFVKDAAISVKDDAVNAVTGIKDTVEGTIATNDQSKLQEGANNIQKKYNQEINNIYGSYIDKGAVAPDGGADESQMSKQDLDKIAALKAAKEKEIAHYKETTNFDEKSKSNQKEYDESQKVDALKTGAAAASTFLNVATLGAGTAVKAGGKQAITQAVKAGGKQAAKEVAKRAAIAGAEGATFGAAGGAASAAANGEDVLKGAAQGAAFGGLVGGATGGATGGVIAKKAGKAASKIDDAARTAVNAGEPLPGIDDLANDLTKEAKINQLDAEATAAEQAGRKAEFDQIQGNRMVGLTDDGTAPASNGQKLLGAGDNARPIEQVDAEIQKMQTEGAPDLTPEQARAKFAALQEERKIALENDAERGFTLEREDARKNFENNGLPNDPVEAQKALDEFDSLRAAPPLKQDAAVTGAQDIFAHQNMPVEVKNAAQELLHDKGLVKNELDKLMSKEKADNYHKQMDEAYKVQESKIAEMPAPRQEIELQKLNDRYTSDLQELDSKVQDDATKITQLTRISEHLDNKEAELVRQSNYLMEQSPDQFRSLDETEFNAQRTSLAENLDTAKRFNDPEAIVDDVSRSPRPEKVVESDHQVRQAYQTEIAKNIDAMPKLNNLNGVRTAALNVTSPSINLEKLGVDPSVFANIVRGTSRINRHVQEALEQEIVPIVKRITSKEQASQIVDFVEGKRTTLSSFDEETAGMIKDFFAKREKVLNDMGFNTRKNYFPHFFNKNDADVQRLFKSPTTGTIEWGNLKQRISNSNDFSRDIGDVLQMYDRGFARKVHLEPALKPLEDIKLQTGATKQVGNWVDKYIEQLKGITEPSGAEEAFNSILKATLGEDTRINYRNTLGTQRMVSAVATMGANPGTAIRNMTQVVNTQAQIGTKYATVGAIDARRAFAAGKGSAQWNEMIDSGIMDGGVSKNFAAEFDKAMNVNTLSGKTEKATHLMMGMIRGTDVSLRAQAYWGAKAKALAEGMTEQKAKDYAIGIVAKSQFMTSAVDMPVKLNGPGVRSLTQLATFSIKQAEMLSQLGVKLVRKDGKWTLDPKTAGNLLGAGVTAMLFTELLKPVIGFNEKEWVPFYDQVASITDPDSTAGESLYRSPLVSLIAGNGKGKIGLLDAIKSGKMDEFLNDNWSQIVPAGTQIKKTVEGLQTTTSGISKNPQGKVRYLQDMGIDNQLKASLFGQYSTDAGRQWIKDGFPTLTESEMRLGSKEGSGDITFEQLPRETQQEFYDYYAATKKVTGRNDTLDKIKEAVRDGNIKKAQRLGDEYNQKATSALQGYFQKHKELPQELQDEMTSKLFIDVQGKIDDALDEE